jgi:Domain of unknown function (DUF4184)
MPFTPAHPAIILPLLRSRYFSATGLVIGSISPDFEYFFKMSVSSEFSHRLGGLFYFDLPITFILALIFHMVVKKNLVRNMPFFFQRRFQDMMELDFLNYLNRHRLIFILSALIGAGSHIFWDSFTHNNTFFTNILPIYKGTYIPYEGVRYPLFYALQHISTALGLTTLGIYLLAIRPTDRQGICYPKLVYWVVLTFIALTIYIIRFALYPSDHILGNAVVSSISALLIALICCGLIKFKNTAMQQA